MSKAEEYFNKKGIDTNDIVCYSTTDGTAEPIDFCPMKFAEAYHQSRVKAISDDEIENMYNLFCNWYEDDGTYENDIKKLILQEFNKLLKK